MQTYTPDTRPAVARASEARAIWSWSAIAAGTLTSLIIQVMLTMLGIGVGLIATDVPTVAARSWETLSAFVRSQAFVGLLDAVFIGVGQGRIGV